MKHSLATQAVTTVGVLALILTLSVLSQAQVVPVPCCTDFNDHDLHGYRSCAEGGVTISLGTPGPSNDPGDWYVHGHDEQSGPNSAICAGPDCLGDWTAIAASGCGALCYDVNMFYDGFADRTFNLNPNVSIGNGLGVQAMFEVTSPAYITDSDGDNPGWHHICAPIALRDLTPSAPYDGLPYNSYGHWVMYRGLPSAWNTLIANVAAMSFRVEASTRHEEVGYDNICLRNDECPPVIPTLSEWGAIIFGTLLLASVALYIWRRRREVTA